MRETLAPVLARRDDPAEIERLAGLLLSPATHRLHQLELRAAKYVAAGGKTANGFYRQVGGDKRAALRALERARAARADTDTELGVTSAKRHRFRAETAIDARVVSRGRFHEPHCRGKAAGCHGAVLGPATVEEP